MIHSGRQYNPIQSQGQGHEPLKVGHPFSFKSYLLHHLQWELATDHGFLNQGTLSKFVVTGFLIFGLVFMSRDFEVGRNVSCAESTISPVRGYFISFANTELTVVFVLTGSCQLCDVVGCMTGKERHLAVKTNVLHKY